MPGDSASLCVMDLNGRFLANLGFFDVKEAIYRSVLRLSPFMSVILRRDLLDVMSNSMDNTKEQQRIRHLAMEPY